MATRQGATRVAVLSVIVGVFFLCQMFACYVSHSLTLLMNTYQTFFNLLSLVLIVISHHIATTNSSLHNTFGWARTEVVGTLVAVLFLFALCFAITTTAIQTLVHAGHEQPEPHYPMLILSFGVVGLAVDIFCYIVIGDPNNSRHPGSYISVQGNRVQVNFVESGSSSGIDKYPCGAGYDRQMTESSEKIEKDLDQQPSIFTEILRTSGSCMTVLICATVLHFYQGHLIVRYIDSVLALVAVVIIVVTFYPHVKSSGLILMQTVPRDIDVEKLQKKMLLKFPALINLHDLHIWTLNSDHAIATIHITLATCSQAEYEDLALEIDDFFRDNGIDSVTIQPEFVDNSFEESEVKCALKCSKCQGKTCRVDAQEDRVVFVTRKRVGSRESLVISPSVDVPSEGTEMKA